MSGDILMNKKNILHF